MIITRSAKHHVSMGNFEWVEFGAEVTINSEELPGPQSLDTLEALATDYLATSLAADVEEARLNTGENKSYIHLYQQENN
ncbi:hypothetical protein [Streptomyces sp. NPDC006631]|uniref:hypothetical protein n=1 Tax=Streptomyces sp. NPDC006631 TaxID=3364752 RepID=UPI0036765350